MKIFSRKKNENLTKGLGAVSVPVLHWDKKLSLRRSLLNKLPDKPNLATTTLLNIEEVKQFAWVSDLVKKLSSSLVLPVSMRVRVKEKLFDKLENTNPLLRPIGFSFLKLASSTLVFIFFVSSAFFYGTTNVNAQAVTVLTKMTGEVFVLREGRQLPAREGMLLAQDDVITTKHAATAEIVYYDDSVSRLNEDTEVYLQKLNFEEDDNDSSSNVILSLRSGDVWVVVPSLAANESSFWVVAGDYVAEVETKAAFHLKAEQNNTYELGVFDSVVYVADKNNNKEPVLNGYKVSLNSSFKVTALSAEEKGSSWVVDNISQDRHYVDNVKNKLISEINEDVSNKLEGDNVSQKLLGFEISLANYEKLLDDGKLEEAKGKLVEIRGQITDLVIDINSVEQSNENEGKNLRDELNRNLALHYRVLTLISSDVDSLQGKSVIYDVKSALAVSDEEKNDLKIQNATDVLVHVADALHDGKNINEEEIQTYVAAAKKVVKEENLPQSDNFISALEDKHKTTNVLPSTGQNAAIVQSQETTVGEAGDVATSNTVAGSTTVGIRPGVVDKPAANSETVLPPQFQINLDMDDLLEQSK